MSSAGSDPGLLPQKGGKDDDIGTGKEYPENKGNKPDKKKEKPEVDPIPEEKMDPERMESLDNRYDGLFNL